MSSLARSLSAASIASSPSNDAGALLQDVTNYLAQPSQANLVMQARATRSLLVRRSGTQRWAKTVAENKALFEVMVPRLLVMPNLTALTDLYTKLDDKFNISAGVSREAWASSGAKTTTQALRWLLRRMSRTKQSRNPAVRDLKEIILAESSLKRQSRERSSDAEAEGSHDTESSGCEGEADDGDAEPETAIPDYPRKPEVRSAETTLTNDSYSLSILR